MFRLMNAAVHFITEAIVDAQSGRRFPRVLKIKIVSLATDGGGVKFISFWRQIRGRRHGVGIGCRGQKTNEGIGELISWMDVMLAAGGGYENGGIRSASTKRVESVRIHSKDRGIAVEAQFRTPLEGMRAARVAHVLFELIDVPVRTEDGTIRGIEALK